MKEADDADLKEPGLDLGDRQRLAPGHTGVGADRWWANLALLPSH